MNFAYRHDGNSVPNGERGSALVYILIAIALLAALTLTFMQPSSQQTSSQSGFRSGTELQGQIDTIRSAIQECRLVYPGGDVNIVIDGTNPLDEGAHRSYPIDPNSPYYSTVTDGPSGDHLVRNIRCPGNPGDDVNHAKIFGGSDGKFLPPAPNMFEDWQYYNSVDGIFFWTQTNKTDSFISSSLQKLDDRFGECEADIIDASGSAKNLDSKGLLQCPSGYTCFRVRMTVNSTAVYNGDTDGDEASCP